MTQRLPIPGSDDGDWGDILNDFLEVSINSDGTLNTAAVTNALPSPIPTANLGTGSASASNFLRGDGAWAVPSGTGSNAATTSSTGLIQLSGDLGGANTSATTPTLAATSNVESIISANATVSGATQKSANLSDITNPDTALSNLGATPALVATSVQTETYAANANQLIPADATSGTFVVTLPTAPTDKTRVTVKKIDSSANAVTVTAGGTDVFNKTSGVTSVTLSLQNQAVTVQYNSSTHIWYVVGDDIPLSSLNTLIAGTYAPIASPALTGAPTVNGNAVVTADELAATAVTYIVSGSPSSGLGQNGDAAFDPSAGNTYTKAGGVWVAGPSLNALEIAGVTVTGTPGAGKQLTATSSSAATWVTPTSSVLVPQLISANYTANAGEYAVANTAAGNVVVTLPSAPPNETTNGVKKITSDSNTVTLTCSGSDVFDVPGGSTSITLSIYKQGVTVEYVASEGVWVVTSDDLPVSQLDLRYAPISGSSASLVVAAGNLGASQAISLSNKTGLAVTATANQAASGLSFTNIAPGARWTLALAQDTTGGRTVTWSGITWVPAGPPTLATAPYAVDLFEFFSPDGANIYGYLSTPHLAQSSLPWATNGVYETYPSFLASNNSFSCVSGTVYLTHFIPDRNINAYYIISFANTAQVGATLCRMGLYQYLGSNNYTCVARTASSTTLWNNTSVQNLAVSDDGQGDSIASVTLQAGTEYAFAFIAIGASIAPRLGGVPLTSGMIVNFANGAASPRRATYLTGQTDLPATLTASSVPSYAPWGGVTPNTVTAQ